MIGMKLASPGMDPRMDPGIDPGVDTGVDRASPRPMRLVLLVSGTGGHFFPALVLARYALEHKAEVTILGDRRLESFFSAPGFSDLSDFSGSCSCHVFSLPRLGRLWHPAQLVLFLKSWLAVRQRIKMLRPSHLVGFGGFFSLFVCSTLWSLRWRRRGLVRPVLVLHEQNIILGRANRLLALWAHAVAVSFEETRKLSMVSAHKRRYTGLPVREIRPLSRRWESLKPLRWLVIGGSQGAVYFKNLMCQIVTLLDPAVRQALWIHHQVPAGHLEELRSFYKASSVKAVCSPFFPDLPELMGQAHLALTRGGASSLAELAHSATPSIILPYPYATDDHQYHNGEAFVRSYGGWCYRQDPLLAIQLAGLLSDLVRHPARLARLSQTMRQAGGQAGRQAGQRPPAALGPPETSTKRLWQCLESCLTDKPKA